MRFRGGDVLAHYYEVGPARTRLCDNPRTCGRTKVRQSPDSFLIVEKASEPRYYPLSKGDFQLSDWEGAVHCPACAARNSALSHKFETVTPEKDGAQAMDGLALVWSCTDDSPGEWLKT